MKGIVNDLRHSLRMYLRDARTSAVIVLTLALGIGASTTVFTILNSVVLQPLSYKQPDRLVRIYSSNPEKDAMYFSVSPPDYLDWKNQSRTLDEMGALTRPQDYHLAIHAEPEKFTGTQVSANLFALLGVEPSFGRSFSSSETSAGGAVILSHDLWASRFGADHEILDRTVLINGKPAQIVGIMPRGFHLPFADAQIFLPLIFAQGDLERSNHFLRIIGRLKEGISLREAVTELKTIALQLERQYPASNKNWTVAIRSMNEVVVPESFRSGLWIFFGAVGLVLLIACVNVANLMVARTLARQREISIRIALGGSRSVLLRQLITESLLPAIAGGAFGLLFAFWVIHAILAFGPGNIPRLQELHLSGRVILFAFSVSLLTALVYGTISALQSVPDDVYQSLKISTNRATVSRSRGKLQDGLVIIEAALAVILLVGACLLIKSFVRLQFVDPGFDANNLLTVGISFPENKFSEQSAISAAEQLIARAGSVAGAKSAAITNLIPMGPGNSMDAFTIEGRGDADSQAAAFRVVSVSYLNVMRIPLLRGRYFSEKDRENSPGAVIIDERMYRRFWPDGNALGSRILLAGSTTPFTVVGIVRNVRSLSLDGEEPPLMYFPARQLPPSENAYLVVRTSENSTLALPEIRKRIHEVHRDIVIGEVHWMKAVIAESLSERQFQVGVLTVFAGIAIFLAAIGIYSVIAFRTVQRTHEIGIRMAVGARQLDVIRLVVRQGILLAAAGIGIGLAGSFAATHLLSSLLFQVSPTDSSMFQFSTLLFLVVAALASYFPGRKASRLDPTIALRQE